MSTKPTKPCTPNKPPRFIKPSDYANWRYQFENYIAFNNPEWLVYFTKKYIPPPIDGQARGGAYNKTVDLMTPEEKEDYEKERKAYAAITMYLSRDIMMLFKKNQTTFELWEAIAIRFGGNVQYKQSRQELLKKQFDMFNQLPNETCDDLMSRFSLLVCELRDVDIELTDIVINNKLLPYTASGSHGKIMQQGNADQNCDCSIHVEEAENTINQNHSALMENIPEVDSNSFAKLCVSCTELQDKIKHYQDHNHRLITEIENLTLANKVLKSNEQLYEEKFKTSCDETHRLKIKILNQQASIDCYLTEIDLQKKEYAEIQSEILNYKRKFSNHSASSFILDEIIHVQKTDTKSKTGIGYHTVPPPMTYSQMPVKDEIKDFSPTASLVETPLSEKLFEKVEKKVSTCLDKKFEEKFDIDAPISIEEEYDEKPVVKSNVKPENFIVTNELNMDVKKVIKNEVNLTTKKVVKNKVAKKVVKILKQKNSPDRESTSKTISQTCSSCSSHSPSKQEVAKKLSLTNLQPRVVKNKKVSPEISPNTSKPRVFVEKRVCFYCGYQGHIMKDCLSYADHKKKRFESKKLFSKLFSRLRSKSSNVSKAKESSVLQKQKFTSTSKQSSIPLKVWRQKKETQPVISCSSHSHKPLMVSQTSKSKVCVEKKKPVEKRKSPKTLKPKVFVERRTCYHCGFQGHIVRNCLSFARHHKTRRSRSRSSNDDKAKTVKVVKNQKPISEHNIPTKQLSKPLKVWKVKMGNEQTVPCDNTSKIKIDFEKNSKLIDVFIIGDDGQPKAVKAWVSLLN